MRAVLKVIGLTENITSTQAISCKHRQIHSSHSRCKASIIDGVKRANSIQDELKKEVSLLEGNRPQLTTVLVGDDYVSHVYIKRKMMAAKAVGISTNTIYLENSCSERDLVSLLDSLNQDVNVNAILVQLPLPNHICERTICNTIAPLKDVDGFNFFNMGRFALGMNALWPCTAMAVHDLITSTGIETKGKHAVICGRSKNVGFPIAMTLHSSGFGGSPGMDATTTICHRHTPLSLLSSLTKSADILISATGVPGLISSSMVKPGACVIDVGITRIHNEELKETRLIGDVDFDGVSKIAGFLTPVPGGVGPMTVAMLLKNTVLAYKLQMRGKG
ncbi:probable bifunctional methylenetetrahydrofolate dehydrogenase/cyclohydrolase 2 isoform X1 [Thrips palmi]|uniref:methenyltetrahydrofolate cyclohydrolase n=1 Tax=Thrips palmi TaxID=161013 RepID=A0A6P8Z5P3_THRPL|nr:probable bifunctional methylenetetrahydrofolate dehydrogenase/cyclohydrolase 2 isoform X1 [Thrips palmi]